MYFTQLLDDSYYILFCYDYMLYLYINRKRKVPFVNLGVTLENHILSEFWVPKTTCAKLLYVPPYRSENEIQFSAEI